MLLRIWSRRYISILQDDLPIPVVKPCLQYCPKTRQKLRASVEDGCCASDPIIHQARISTLMIAAALPYNHRKTRLVVIVRFLDPTILYTLYRSAGAPVLLSLVTRAPNLLPIVVSPSWTAQIVRLSRPEKLPLFVRTALCWGVARCRILRDSVVCRIICGGWQRWKGTGRRWRAEWAFST